MSLIAAEMLWMLVEDGRRDAVPVMLGFDADNPHVITVAFPYETHADEPNEWHFWRDLFRLGFHKATGDGDIRVWPIAGGKVSIRIDNGDDAALFEVAARPLRAFVDATTALVPIGTETVSVDATIAQILAREEAT